MKKQKTQKEVKEEKKLWRNVRGLALALFIMFFVFFAVGKNWELQEKIEKLKTQLSNCQEQVIESKYPCCSDLTTNEGWIYFTPFENNFWILNGQICKINCEIIE